QGEQWGWHPRMSNRLGLFRLVQMPGSHEVMFSNQIGLAEKIIVAGRD
ncbi:alpha/beta hydrolase, partial [Nostoc sp. FACHB-888]|nr:alpha/beta hydrolase [Nostoc sp. FACHB-888]